MCHLIKFTGALVHFVSRGTSQHTHVLTGRALICLSARAVFLYLVGGSFTPRSIMGETCGRYLPLLVVAVESASALPPRFYDFPRNISLHQRYLDVHFATARLSTEQFPKWMMCEHVNVCF